MRNLTDRQAEIYRFLVAYTGDHGYPPTIREIGRWFGIHSTKGVTDHLWALERKGYIRRELGKARAISLLVHRAGGGRASVPG